MHSAVVALLALLALSRVVKAGTVVAGPADGEMYYVGETCRTSWQTDGTQPWTNVKVELLSGVDTPILTIIDNLDTSGSQVLSFACPQVTVYSNVYFFRYTDHDSKNVSYSGHFTIADRKKVGGVRIAQTSTIASSTTVTLSGASTATTFAVGTGKIVGHAGQTVNDYRTGKPSLNPSGAYKQNAASGGVDGKSRKNNDLASSTSAPAHASSSSKVDSKVQSAATVDQIANAAISLRAQPALLTVIIILGCLWVIAVA